MDERVTKIVNEFKSYSHWEERYKHLISLGKSLNAMNESDKSEVNKIKGCQSQVWLSASLSGDKVTFSADSDASIVKGIVALLLHVYSERTPDEILAISQDFIDEIGLRQHLSMSRANGLSSMLKQITFYGMAFKAKLTSE